MPPFPMLAGEGPIGLVLCPSRELARQTYDVANHFASHISASGTAELRTMLCIGGVCVCGKLSSSRACSRAHC